MLEYIKKEIGFCLSLLVFYNVLLRQILHFCGKIVDTWLVLLFVLVDFGLDNFHCVVANFLCGHCQNLFDGKDVNNIEMHNRALEWEVFVDLFRAVDGNQSNGCFGALRSLETAVFER